MTSLLVKKVSMENESSISLGGNINVIFSAWKCVDRVYTPLYEKGIKQTRNSQMETTITHWVIVACSNCFLSYRFFIAIRSNFIFYLFLISGQFKSFLQTYKGHSLMTSCTWVEGRPHFDGMWGCLHDLENSGFTSSYFKFKLIWRVSWSA